ncbi:MAG: molecular chaperone DnaJ [Novosphingobium sp.]
MAKLLIIAVLLTLVCKTLFRVWPWDLVRLSEQSQRAARARALLGVPRHASRAQIAEAHRRLISSVHPDRGGTHDQVLAANAARDLLLKQLDGKGLTNTRQE